MWQNGTQGPGVLKNCGITKVKFLQLLNYRVFDIVTSQYRGAQWQCDRLWHRGSGLKILKFVWCNLWAAPNIYLPNYFLILFFEKIWVLLIEKKFRVCAYWIDKSFIFLIITQFWGGHFLPYCPLSTKCLFENGFFSISKPCFY